MAIAIAIQDELEDTGYQSIYDLPRKPKIAFLEKQTSFGWHSGMLIEGAKMQISFIKDLATLRNPRSRFTFLNYLHHKRRLIQFSDLNTFLPSRVEFEDYLQWCSEHFSKDVFYGEEVLDVAPNSTEKSGIINTFVVRSRNVLTQKETTLRTKHIVIAIGGKPHLPDQFGSSHSRIIHSSKYIKSVPKLLKDRAADYNIAIIGSGQSAAEVFDNLHSRYPNSRTHLIMRQSTLRPSDDSPFVNEIFDPKRIQPFYDLPRETRSSIISHNRNTNYSVVRLELLEKLYETLYLQRIPYDSEDKWPHRIIPNADIQAVFLHSAEEIGLEVSWSPAGESSLRTDKFCYDLVVVATGYKHDGYEDLLHPVFEHSQVQGKGSVTAKDYRLVIPGLKIDKDAGIWLQGCNEETHGVSCAALLIGIRALTRLQLGDTLLSGLAIRGSEVVRSIFENASTSEVDGTR